MASDFRKPDLIHTLFSYEIEEKMWPLTVDNLFMCGSSSVETLRKLEIITIGDLAKANPQILSSHLKSHGITLWEFANGQDFSKVEPIPAQAKGIGNSTTVQQDIETGEDAYPVLTSGYRIGPFEIESTIMELPYVLECGVSAAPDEVRGQVVKASIVLVPGTEPTEELKKEIQNYVKTHTAPYKYPRIVVFRDELPKTISGKIQRNKL